jgi:hypothetical protein
MRSFFIHLLQKTSIQTQFKDLSNEIFFNISDYLHALNIFTAFYSLNQRISSILQFISLRIIITEDHCCGQVDYLSSHRKLSSSENIGVERYSKEEKVRK